MGRQGWKVSFDRGDSFTERQQAHRPLPPPGPDPGRLQSRRQPLTATTPTPEGHCSRGEWCSARTVTSENGQRTVIPAPTPRAYCDACQDHITACLEDFPELYERLHAEITEHHQGELAVHAPFGPSVPLNTAVDAQMRAMTETLCSWEERLRDIAGLSDLGRLGARPQDDLADLGRSLGIIVPRVSMLLSLAPMEMTRFVATWAVREEDLEGEVVADNAGILKVTVMLDGRRAGQEIMHLHYMARRLLLETNPAQPLLPDFRCRVCEQRLLRKAAPPWHEDGEWYWSRCDGCGDEMTRKEYDRNAKRWLAYERAHLETPVLAG